MKKIIALLSLIVLFPVLMVLKVVATLLGFVVVAIALPFHKEIIPAPEWDRNAKRTVYDGWTFVALPWWAQRVWGSYKYGARGNWFWPEYYEDTKSFKAMYHWLAIRNSCGGLDELLYTYDYEQKDIEYIGDEVIDDNRGIEGIRFSWHKDMPWRSNFTILKRWGRFYFWWRVGYKHTPGTGVGTAVFATQPLPNPFKKI